MSKFHDPPPCRPKHRRTPIQYDGPMFVFDHEGRLEHTTTKDNAFPAEILEQLGLEPGDYEVVVFNHTTRVIFKRWYRVEGLIPKPPPTRVVPLGDLRPQQ